MSISAAIASSDVEYVQSARATRLRDLDAFEEFFWLLEQNINVFHAAVVEVNGPTTIEQWKAAIDAVQVRYPLLSASIRKIPGKRPFFEKVQGASMPLRIVPLPDSIVPEQEMENELQKTFGDGSSPLSRATLFHSWDRSVLIVASHHASMDGKSHLLLIDDLVAHVAGEDPGEPLDVQPGLGQLLGLPVPAEYVSKLEARSVAPENGARANLPRIRVRRLQLSVEETATLLRRTKEEGTTVHTALIVALALAGQRSSKEWRTGTVRCLSPVDMRKDLRVPDAAGLLISAHTGPVATPDGAISFWEIARALRKDMLPAQSLDGAQQILGAFSSMVAEEHNARDFYLSALNGPLQYELMVTNYAGYAARTKYGNLEIANLFTGSSPVKPAQKVSVVTVNGKMSMTLVARELFPTLLEDARQILTRV